MIGDLYDVMRPCVCIDQLALFLERRRILNAEQRRFFVSQSVYDPNFETYKFNRLIEILQTAAQLPGGECLRSLYLSLCDFYHQRDDASAQQHLNIALYLRKRGKNRR